VGETPTAEQLLADAAWLKRLAVTLAGDSDDADDLVQESWIAAWQRRPDTERPLRPWLSKVMRDLAGMRRRSERRRAAREHAATVDDHHASAPDALLAQVRLHRLLADLVLDLDEPFRSTIIARFVEGRTAASIARALGIPESTVRGRVREALARLRAQLDAQNGERKAWAPAVIALAQGGMAVAKPANSIIAGIVLIALLIGVVVLLVGSLGGDEIPSLRESRPEGTATLPSRTSSAPRESSRGRGSEELLPSWLTGMGGISHPIGGIVVDEKGAPFAGATVELQSWTSALSAGSEARVVTGRDGAFRFEPRARWNYAVVATAPSHAAAVVTVDSRAPQDTMVMVEGAMRPLPALGAIVLMLTSCEANAEGIVTDSGGGTIAGVTVQDLRGLPGPFGPSVTTGADGRYSICLTAGEHRLAFGAEGYEHVWRVLRAQGRQRVDVELAVGAVVTGQVVDADTGAPVQSAQIGLWPWVWFSGGPSHRAAVSGADGRFEVRDVGAGRFQVTVWDRERGLSHAEQVTVEPGQQVGPVVLRLTRGVAVNGVVRLNGEPLASKLLAIAIPSVPGTARAFQYITNADGKFVVHGVSPNANATIEIPGYDVRSPTSIDTSHGPAANVIVDVVARPMLRGTVQHRGRPVANAEVKIIMPSGMKIIRANAIGRFEIDVAPGSYTLIGASEAIGAFSATAITVAVPLKDDVAIELDGDARITGKVFDSSGAVVIGAEVIAVRQQGDDRGASITALDGTFIIDQLAGNGDYELSVRPFGGASQPFAWAGEPPSTINFVDSHMQAGPIHLAVERSERQIAGVVSDDNGAPVPDAIIRLGPGVQQMPPGPAWPTARSDDSGRFRLVALGPGPFSIEASLGNGPRATVSNVAAGANEVVIRLVRTGEIRGNLIGLRDAHVWLRRMGGVGGLANYVAHVDGDQFSASDLVPGQYAVAALANTKGGAAATATVEVNSGAIAWVTLTARRPGAVIGQVVWFGTSSPVEGASCTAAPASGLAFPPGMEWSTAQRGISDGGGQFRIEGAPDGDVVVWCGRSREHTTGLARASTNDAAKVVVVRRNDENPGSVGIQWDWTVINARVASVDPGSPAARAGVLAGDRVVGVDGANVEQLGPEPVLWLIGSRPRGSRVPIAFERNGARFKRTLIVEPERP